ncbi:MAG TPA: SRPBCC domain-containing protein [Candidatus Limnocylindria bacterium]|nr:SRPBCC domain-containing protein [Candidatus Limnocylindria bacterium]
MAETRTLTLERVFDAPVEKVWAAWTEAERIGKWWGPKGFTSSDNKIDLRVDGRNNLHMHAPAEFGGQDTYSGGKYKEIVSLKKIVVTDEFTDKDGKKVSPGIYGMPDDFPQSLVTVEFDALPDGKTKLTVTHAGLPAGEMSDQTSAGWNESLDKLAESLR